jgi:hypothetical protein
MISGVLLAIPVIIGGLAGAFKPVVNALVVAVFVLVAIGIAVYFIGWIPLTRQTTRDTAGEGSGMPSLRRTLAIARAVKHDVVPFRPARNPGPAGQGSLISG